MTMYLIYIRMYIFMENHISTSEHSGNFKDSLQHTDEINVFFSKF